MLRSQIPYVLAPTFSPATRPIAASAPTAVRETALGNRSLFRDIVLRPRNYDEEAQANLRLLGDFSFQVLPQLYRADVSMDPDGRIADVTSLTDFSPIPGVLARFEIPTSDLPSRPISEETRGVFILDSTGSAIAMARRDRFTSRQEKVSQALLSLRQDEETHVSLHQTYPFLGDLFLGGWQRSFFIQLSEAAARTFQEELKHIPIGDSLPSIFGLHILLHPLDPENRTEEGNYRVSPPCISIHYRPELPYQRPSFQFSVVQGPISAQVIDLLRHIASHIDASSPSRGPAGVSLS